MIVHNTTLVIIGLLNHAYDTTKRGFAAQIGKRMRRIFQRVTSGVQVQERM